MSASVTLDIILSNYRNIAFSERDKGDRFERLMQAYLMTDPKYANLFKKVWMWNEFPGKNDLGGVDTGIDLVALTFDGDYWAIQCKFYDEKTTIDKKSVDTFLATSSRSFKGEDLKTTNFSQCLWISTSNNWTGNATEALKNQQPPVSRITIADLYEAPVDWGKLEQNITGELARNEKKQPRGHQIDAINNTHEHFQTHNRGKLIMACGTGKTLTSLFIAEKETNNKGLVLFLVPSIALLGQTLNEWSADAQEPINAICICSDPEITKSKKKDNDTDLTSVIDLAMPASTNVANIISQFEKLKHRKNNGMTVVFSTYQSIEVISQAQTAVGKRFPEFAEFDLIICDEAHRTTGVQLSGEDESAFTKVHDNDFIKAKKRLYMTATPRLYDAETKTKAAQAEALLCSMDDENIYGQEMYRIGFGEAVSRELLTDYKVLILTLSENDVPPVIQNMITNGESEIRVDDMPKLIGCINALSKQVLGDEGIIAKHDPLPMKRALAFCSTIANSETITQTFNAVSDTYIEALPIDDREKTVSLTSQHIDGTMDATQRAELLGWLKAEPEEGECRVLTNVRCLSEGVDVPSLDAVMFLSARNSQVDVVQSVGRVMRRAPGKQYGYIIIPVVVPSTVSAEKALDDNERFKVVWTVLNALRAHDDRFEAEINKINLNKKKPSQVLVGGTPFEFDSEGNPIERGAYDSSNAEVLNNQLRIEFEELQSAVFARMVLKVGDRLYWEQWAKSIADIAVRQMERIEQLIDNSAKHAKEFDKFLKGLQKNINPSIQKEEAVEMLSQHLITKPVFEALFEEYSFVENNPMSKSMQKMLDLLEGENIAEDEATLQKFFDSVKMRASGIDNAEGKQKIIIELYDKFFKTAFPKMVERLGIVYTPTEVVDFIIHSVNDVLQAEFGRTLSDNNVHILDPFTGTGTFITRLLQSGLINPEDLKRKYKKEIHANEIVLLAYYIASVNIENVYHDLVKEKKETKVVSISDNNLTDNTLIAAAETLEYTLNKSTEYVAFDGICLTDTFQLGEKGAQTTMLDDIFPQNSKRVQEQKKAPIKVIIGNPPYSIGQKSANDNAQNQKYPTLDNKIANTYATLSNAGLNKSLYDAYIKAFRWSSDRLKQDEGGIIAFVSNGAWLEGNSTDGFRKSLEKEFSKIYVFNLRGNARTSGEQRRKEAGNVFLEGSRTPISITLLVKNPKYINDKAKIYYRDIGDYLTREQKLNIVSEAKSFLNSSNDLVEITPNEHGDWINHRNDGFDNFISIEPDKKLNLKSHSFFIQYGVGIATNRDAWVYNFNSTILEKNMISTIDIYNRELKHSNNIESKVTEKELKWTVNLKNYFKKGIKLNYNKSAKEEALYRPYCISNLYTDKYFIERPGIFDNLIIKGKKENKIIMLTGMGSSKDFSLLITDKRIDIQTIMNGQIFPLYYYEVPKTTQKGLFDDPTESNYVRRDAISDFIFERAKKQYGKTVTREDIFYYVYGFLHSNEYRETFANDLKKMLPKLPLVESVKDFWAFSKAGRDLAELHLNYESIAPYQNVIITGEESDNFKVTKMKFPKKGEKGSIIYNSHIIISNIPDQAYEYVVNGKSAIEWIMDRYQISTHKDSGITNDPNDWADEVSNPRYILDLLLSIINVSVQTVDIVNSLPKVKFE
ncbi:DEAD/DEAH box helicase [Myroides odoratimimus]|uniref:DEAD/DEAH box helicase n=1 Tax=Myroides odoratimimus TaxID=76832 RepID=UPI002575EEAA|nr:type ISP restriction/modification enzyme [Myroides odoratimimus]MDM1499636.1 DEAD/DEAH box helicase [Myroides odoratimimus]